MKPSSLARNTTFYTVALAAQKVLSFLYFIIVARAIGVEGMGKFSFALSFTTMFAMLLDFGLNQVLIRESARDRELSQKYLSNILGLKIIGSVFIYLAVALLINLMNYPLLTKQLVYVSGLVMILDSFALSFYGVLRGFRVLRFESLGVVANQVIVMALGVAVIKLDWGLVPLMGAYLMGSLFNFFYSAILLKVKADVRPGWRFNKSIIRQLLRLALPFAIAGIFIRIYSYLDVVLLSKLADDQAVGFYSVAYKAAFALQFIGIGSLASIYPAFSSYFVTDKKALAKSFTKALYYLLVLSLPISFGIIAIADKIIGPIFGEQYAGSVPALQIMIAALPLAFICFPIGAMLNSCNRQTANTVILGLTALTNTILNLILIPRFGYVGSAVAVPLSYLVLFGGGIAMVNKIVQYDKKYLIRSLLKIIASGVLMALAVLYLKERYHFAVAIAVGIVIYPSALFLLKGVSKGDLFEVRDLVFKNR